MAAKPGKRLATNAAANVLQMFFGSLLLFALYRYINGALGVGSLGVWSVVAATVSASRLADFGLSAGVTRFVARENGRNDLGRATSVVDTAALTLMVAVSVVLPLAYGFATTALPWFFQAKYLQQALTILPLALASLWLTMVGSVFQGGLDGCQRMHLRAGLALAGQLLLFVLSIVLVPEYGLAGLVWAQIGQGIFLIVASRLVLRSVMPGLPLLPKRWNRSVLKEMLGYGANLQASTLFILLFDPIAKALMARYGGPASAGYFEMANQVVMRVRSMIVAANQAVVPHVAEWSDADLGKVTRFYRKNLRVLIFATVSLVSLLMAAGPVISWLLTGGYRAEFLQSMLVLSIAWGFNILGSPAYFINQGTGHVGTNTLTHAITGVISTSLAILLGVQFNGVGVLVGYVTGLIIGTVWQIWAFRRRYHTGTLGAFLSKEHAWLLLASSLVAAWAISMRVCPSLSQPTVVITGLVLAVALLGSAVWFHKLCIEFQRRLCKQQTSRA